ncbi:hypothetical protein AF332_11415 [Sporosarcina globispora]|uniref:Uncharacterized protein n=1 Tax=Sporosarcina globispora TaxID=1459 RepID=A0A0M0GCV6_SPOGL|nr:hypothetical protein [Sporosarcina globispora]KON87372.1 hypothetical protein AF332_11415 [Sporosarcina globispora]
MITINKVLLHDKKRLKHFSQVLLYYKDIHCNSIVETNLKTLESKINYVMVLHGGSEEADKEIRAKGYKPDQNILDELQQEEKEMILETIRQSEILKKYL